jgi:molybdenum-dependent DNA-binding transcriptional regulator ModE
MSSARFLSKMASYDVASKTAWPYVEAERNELKQQLDEAVAGGGGGGQGAGAGASGESMSAAAAAAAAAQEASTRITHLEDALEAAKSDAREMQTKLDGHASGRDDANMVTTSSTAV